MKPLYNLHSTNLKQVTSKDDLRPALQGVYFDKDNERLVATDGHVLVCIPVDSINEADVSAIIPVQAFDKRALQYEVSEKETTVHYANGSVATFPNISEPYPNYVAVIPSGKGVELNSIAFDIHLAGRLASFMKCVSTKYVRLLFTFHGENKAITFRGIDYELSGLIMPTLKTKK